MRTLKANTMNLANKITTLRLILVPVFVAVLTPMPKWAVHSNVIFQFINNYNIYIATTIFGIAAITDKLDGYIARKYNQITKLGCFLDPLADKLLIISALMLLVEANKIAGWIALVIISREIAVTGLRTVAAINNKVLAADKYGKAKLVLQVITIPLFLLNDYPFKFFTNFPIDNVMLFFTVLITIYSGINYFVKNKDVFCDNGKLII
jgi:CDP-diacylglycerol--glycerol-3-phosphate 3-phosphatidyltransferase